MMRVSLNHARKTRAASDFEPARPLLDTAGARVILGQKPSADGLAEPIRPSPNSLFGPRGAVLGSRRGPFFVCDTGHHRLLVWNSVPTLDGAAADIVIGQQDFFSEGRNGKAAVGPATLNVPTGIAASEGILAVADAWNHRVLIWRGYPTCSNQLADVVLGQADFGAGLSNRGSSTAKRDTLNWCYGVAIVGEALYVADTGNRRVLRWNSIPRINGAPADLVLGQVDFETRDENAGRAPNDIGMRWPHGIAEHRGSLFVADAGNNRVMVWNGLPKRNGEPCEFVLGQADPNGVDHNQAAYYPTPATLNMPYGLALLGGHLVTADTANCRLVGYDLKSVSMNAKAEVLSGQSTFQDKGENRWGLPRRDSLCWPYGVAALGNQCAVADSGNNRVLLWEASP